MNQNGIINIYPRIILIIILLIIDVLCGLNSVTVSPLSINSIATYTWSISLTSTPISSLSLTFASQVTILANSTLTINTASQSFTKSGNTITIATSISSSALSIVITNIQNPSSAISTNSFSYTTNLNTTPTILSSFNSVQYLSGTLSSCSWSFSLCT